MSLATHYMDDFKKFVRTVEIDFNRFSNHISFQIYLLGN
jgi:hypothetical protein